MGGSGGGQILDGFLTGLFLGVLQSSGRYVKHANATANYAAAHGAAAVVRTCESATRSKTSATFL